MSAGINGTAVFFWTSLDVEQAESRRQKNKLLINAGIHGTSDRCFIFSIARIAVAEILAMVAGRADLVKFL
jgi:predicted chitinase